MKNSTEGTAAIDWGGGSIKYALGNGATTTDKTEFPKGNDGYGPLLGKLRQLIPRKSVSALVVAFPVPIITKRNRRIFMPISNKGLFLRGEAVDDLEAELVTELGVAIATIMNDGEAAAHGELAGVVKSHERAFVCMAGTSYSGALINSGTVLTFPCTFSHVPIDPRQGPPCEGTRHRGCLKATAGGAALLERAVQMGLLANAEQGLQRVSQIAETGTPDMQGKARDFYEHLADCLAQAFAIVARVAAIDCISLGGGIAEAGNHLFDPLRQRFLSGDYLEQEIAQSIDIRHSQAGKDAVLEGLKYYADQQL